MTQQEFIARAREIHGDRYDYSKVEYVNSQTKVCIICPEHGEFWQRPASHLKGMGCKKCAAHCAKQKSRKKVYGKGVLDVDFSCNKDEITTKAYKIFGAMFRRCNSPIGSKHNPAYHDCFVCDEWHYFSNFLSWFKDNYIKGYALDKDILVKGNKMYSPETCCFVPIEINSLLTNRRNHRGNALGTFKTKKEAFTAYKQCKESYITEVAQKYYNDGKITKRVYDALMKYEVEITD